MDHEDVKEAKEALWRFMGPVRDSDVIIHDKHWLKLIIDWQPKVGLPLSEIARWFNLIEIVNEIDEEEEGELEINEFQKNLIQARMEHEEFITGTEPQWIGFVMDYKKATGFNFKNEEPQEPDSAKD